MEKPNIVLKECSNKTKRLNNKIRFIVLHHSGGHKTGDLDWLTRKDNGQVSADFYITKTGAIYQLNPDVSKYYTWHAGKSKYRGFTDINKRSIGIEMEHIPGVDKWEPAQIDACGHLCAYLMLTFGLKLEDSPITSHAAVAVPIGRKIDPKDFKWEEFSKAVKSHL